MNNYSLTVQPRTLTGRKVKRLRAQDIVPGNMYGQGTSSKPVQLSKRELLYTYREVGYTGLISLQIEGQKSTHPVLISRIQQDPITEHPIHIDFRKVNLKQKLIATVPIEFVGESQAVKDGAVFSSLITEIEVEALPQDFPESIEVDISKLVEINDQLTVADLEIDQSKLELQLEADSVIAKVEAQRAEEEPTESESETEEVGEESTESTETPESETEE